MSFSVIDLILFVRKSAVAKIRKRFMKSTIEPSSQSAFMMKEMKENTESVNIIEFQKKISTQRDSFRFEIVENIVSEKKIISIRDKIADRDKRARNRDRNRNRSRNRDRDRDKGRGNNSACARNENER